MQPSITTDTLSKINELAIQAGKNLGLTVIDTRLSGQSGEKSIEICIFRPNTDVSFDDCQSMSKNFEQVLEQEATASEPLVQGPFMIEVVSPGIERKLTTAAEFRLFAGKAVRIQAKQKIGTLGIEFTAVLGGGDENSIVVNEAQPLAKQNHKKNSRQINTSGTSGDQMSIALSQIYGIYLWPGHKSSDNQLRGGFFSD